MNKIKNNVRLGTFIGEIENKHNKEIIKSKTPAVNSNIIADDSDEEEEEPKAWEALSLEFKDVKKVINTLEDKSGLIVWNKKKKLGKISYKNFNEWCDVMIEDLHKMQKKGDDDEIFR